MSLELHAKALTGKTSRIARSREVLVLRPSLTMVERDHEIVASSLNVFLA